jgi:transcriptional regulator with GAF, ATPase, and Fis domain
MDTEKISLKPEKSHYETFIPQPLDEVRDQKKELNSRDVVIRQFVDCFCIKDKIPFRELICFVERNILVRALSEYNGNQKIAAKHLGIKYTTLHEKVKKYNIRFQKTPY